MVSSTANYLVDACLRRTAGLTGSAVVVDFDSLVLSALGNIVATASF
jgi:hypothetical protein